MRKILNVAIGVPSGNTWEADFGICLIDMIGYMRSHPVRGYEGLSYEILSRKSSLLPKSRTDIVKKAIEEGADYLLFLDSDQTFPPDVFNQLLARGKEVIGCNIALKTLPSAPTVRSYKEGDPFGQFVYSNGKTGVERVWRMGFGVMLIDMKIFKEVPEPWFIVGWSQDTGAVGEDWYFCEQLEKAGIELWVDHDASLKVGHLGGYVYRHEDIKAPEEIPKPGFVPEIVK